MAIIAIGLARMTATASSRSPRSHRKENVILQNLRPARSAHAARADQVFHRQRHSRKRGQRLTGTTSASTRSAWQTRLLRSVRYAFSSVTPSIRL